MKATIIQENGVSLSIEPIDGSENPLVSVRLVGTKLSAEITEGLEPAFDGMGSLSAFLKKAALLQTEQYAVAMSGESPSVAAFCIA